MIVGAGSICFVLLLSACKPKQETTETGNTDPVITEPSIPELIVDPALDREQPNGKFNVTGLEINGDILSVALNYSGGCKEHEFKLYSDGKYAKSMPPQLTLWMQHIDNEDACRKLILDTLQFDITKARYENQSEVIIRMNNTKQTARYTYTK